MKISLIGLFFLIAATGHLAAQEDKEYAVGHSFLDEKHYETVLKLSDLYKSSKSGGLDFPVSPEKAAELCSKHLVENLPQYKNYVCMAASLINYADGRILQLLYVPKLREFKAPGSDVALFLLVTHDGRVLGPRLVK